MRNERPTPPLCHCSEPMKLVRTLRHIEGVPEIFVFYCPHCKQAETKVLERVAVDGLLWERETVSV
jgi:hypothetical protein